MKTDRAVNEFSRHTSFPFFCYDVLDEEISRCLNRFCRMFNCLENRRSKTSFVKKAFPQQAGNGQIRTNVAIFELFYKIAEHTCAVNKKNITMF